METIIYLTRHGQTEWNLEKRLQGRGNSPLTEAGIERAKELRGRIHDLGLDIIYSSPIERALHTAKILKGDENIPLHTHEGLVEMSFGDYEGCVTEEVMKEHPEWQIESIMKGNTTMCAPNGETLEEVRGRVKQTMDELLEAHKGQTLLIVTHGITLKALMYYFQDEAADAEVMGQATLTKIRVHETGEVETVYKNDDSHFTIKEKVLGW